ncbi:MAG: PEP-CTERM sorting domain-containing protein [Burkholderiales bacterium]|nr:MAG: PEP-CTERM sorting domain-containing protein [Burkholderiales bacterium]
MNPNGSLSAAFRLGLAAAVLATAASPARSAHIVGTLDWSSATWRVESLSGIDPPPTLSWMSAPTVNGTDPAFAVTIYTSTCCTPFAYLGIGSASDSTRASTAVSTPSYGGAATGDSEGLSATAYARGPGTPSRQSLVIVSGSRPFELSDPGVVTFTLPFSVLAAAPEPGDFASSVLYATVYGPDGTAVDAQSTGYAVSSVTGQQGGTTQLLSLTYTGLQPLSQGRLEGILQIDIQSSSPVSAVPEPSTWGMTLAGLALCMWAARRRSGSRG